MPQSFTLSVSNPKLNCNQLAKYLLYSGIPCLISPNTSIQCDDTKKCWIEKGCQITHRFNNKDDIKKLWKIIKKPFNLSCAHLNIHGIYNGCILNYTRPSLCDPPVHPSDK